MEKSENTADLEYPATDPANAPIRAEFRLGIFPPLALSVPLSRFTSRVGGGSAFFVRPTSRYETF
jgi:hypothetical protein